MRAQIDTLKLKKKEGSFSESTNDMIEKFISRFHLLILTGDVLDPKPRLKISKTIDEDFRKYIIRWDEPERYKALMKGERGELPAYKKIRQAYLKIFEYLHDFFKDYQSENDFKNIVNKIVNSLENNQIFLLIVVGRYSDAFAIFESINARGRALTIVDLVKNLSFKKLYDRHIEDENWLNELEDFWDVIKARIAHFGDFIYHLWVSMKGSCPKNKVYSSLEREFDKMSIAENEDFVIVTIDDESKAYELYEIPEKQLQADDHTKLLLEQYSSLKSLRAKRCYPILLSLDYCLRKKNISQEEHLAFIKKLASLTFWYSGICENDAKRLEKEYHSIAKRLRENDHPKLDKYNEIIDSFFPKIDVSEINFISNQFTDENIINMILRSVEKHLKPKSEYELSDSRTVVTVEHILPLNPYKKSKWWSLFSEVEHSDEKNKIGNLTLLLGGLNRSVSNKDFEIKKKEYQKSDLALNKEIIKVDTWNKEEIQNISKSLFKYAKEIWKYPT